MRGLKRWLLGLAAALLVATGAYATAPAVYSTGQQLLTAATLSSSAYFPVQQGPQVAAISSRQLANYVGGGKFIALSATYTLTSTTAAQKLFNTPTTGEIAVDAATTYLYQCQFVISSMSATSGNAGFDIKGAGTATVTSAAMTSNGVDATTLTTAASSGGAFVASTGQTADIVPAAVGTAMWATINGIVRINAAGTLIPSVSLTTAAAAVVQTNSFCRLWPIGAGTVTSN